MAIEEQQGQQHAGQLPQYSADGRWVWDGQQWTPVQQIPVAAQRDYPSPPLASPTGGARLPQSEGAVPQWPTGFLPPTALKGSAVPTMAGWALGLGIATILVSFLVWVLSGFFPPGKVWAALIMIVVVSVAFVFGELSLVFGMRSQWQVAQSHKPPGDAGIAIAGWICGACGLAVLLLWLLVTLVPSST